MNRLVGQFQKNQAEHTRGAVLRETVIEAAPSHNLSVVCVGHQWPPVQMASCPLQCAPDEGLTPLKSSKEDSAECPMAGNNWTPGRLTYRTLKTLSEKSECGPCARSPMRRKKGVVKDGVERQFQHPEMGSYARSPRSRGVADLVGKLCDDARTHSPYRKMRLGGIPRGMFVVGSNPSPRIADFGSHMGNAHRPSAFVTGAASGGRVVQLYPPRWI